MCAIGFGVAFLAETALTARGQEILTVQLQMEGRCVVWGAPVEGAGVTSSRGVALLAPLDVPGALSAQWRDGRIVAGKARLGCARQFTEVTCVACYAAVYNATARETLFERLLGWLATVKGHVLVGGDFNADLGDSPALFGLLDRGYQTANVGHDMTCCAHGSSKGSVIDHLLLSPSLQPAFREGFVMSEAPFPTHRPVVADLAGRLVEDTWETLRLPRHLPVQGCASTTDASTRYAVDLSRIVPSLRLGAPLRPTRLGSNLLRLIWRSPVRARANMLPLVIWGGGGNRSSVPVPLFALLDVPCVGMPMPDVWNEPAPA